jgi:hypothetical protein
MVLIAVPVPALAIEPQGTGNPGVASNMIAQSKIVSDALAAAEHISKALSQSGYKADFCRNNWVRVYLKLVPTLARSFVVSMEASGRVTTMTLKPRSTSLFALRPE